jgi:hypothetical protein
MVTSLSVGNLNKKNINWQYGFIGKLFCKNINIYSTKFFKFLEKKLQ